MLTWAIICLIKLKVEVPYMFLALAMICDVAMLMFIALILSASKQ